MFIREWGKWGRQGRLRGGGTCPSPGAQRSEPQVARLGTPKRCGAGKEPPAEGGPLTGAHNPDESRGMLISCHEIPGWKEPPQWGPLTGARLPGESRGVLISRRRMPAAPLPRLCQYLEPHGSRPAAGAPPLQSNHRHSPSSSLGWTVGRPSHQLRQPLHQRSDGGTVVRTSTTTAAGSIRGAPPGDHPLRALAAQRMSPAPRLQRQYSELRQ